MVTCFSIRPEPGRRCLYRGGPTVFEPDTAFDVSQARQVGAFACTIDRPAAVGHPGNLRYIASGGHFTFPVLSTALCGNEMALARRSEKVMLAHEG